MSESMPISDEPDAYQTYLLRLWRAQCQGKWQWRASLESPHTGERQVFASLEQLFAFLGERCERHTSPEGQPVPAAGSVCPRGVPGAPEAPGA